VIIWHKSGILENKQYFFRMTKSGMLSNGNVFCGKNGRAIEHYSIRAQLINVRLISRSKMQTVTFTQGECTLNI